MKTLFKSIAGYLPAQYQNAVPIIIVAPEKSGKSIMLMALAEYLQQLGCQQGLSDVVWSKLVLDQYRRVVVEQKPTQPTPSIKSLKFEYVAFRMNGKSFLVIEVAGEDLVDEFGVDPNRISALLRDAIVVFGFHPLLVFQEGAPTAAHFAVRSMAYLISHAFGWNAADSIKKSLKLWLSFHLTAEFNLDFERCLKTLEDARFGYEPTGTTPQSRFFLLNSAVNQAELDLCDLAIAEVVKSVVGASLPIQRQIEGALDKHPRVIRKIIRMDLLGLAPANGVYPDDLLRQRLGAAPNHLTVGGPDLRSRLQASREELLVVEGPHTDGPSQLFKAIELITKREQSLQSRRERQAQFSLVALATLVTITTITASTWGASAVVNATGIVALSLATCIGAWFVLRAVPFAGLKMRWQVPVHSPLPTTQAPASAT